MASVARSPTSFAAMPPMQQQFALTTSLLRAPARYVCRTPSSHACRGAFALLLLCLVLISNLPKATGAFPLAVIAPITSLSHEFLAAAVCFDVDFRKNAEPDLVERFGPPILEVPNLSADLRFNVTVATTDSNVNTAFNAMTRLMQGGVKGLVGPYYSTTSIVSSRFGTYYKVPEISFGATSPELSDKSLYKYFLRTIPSDVLQGRGMYKFMQYCTIRSASFIYSLEPYGEGLFEVVSANAPAGSVSFTVTAFPLPYTIGTPNVTSTSISIKKAMEAAVAKVIFLGMTTDQVVNFLPIAAEVGLFSSSYQVVGSENVHYGAGPAFLPEGFMYFSPTNKGSLYPAFESMMKVLTPDDLYSDEAKGRYDLGTFEVNLADGSADYLTSDSFEATGITEIGVSFLFDAAYTFVFALNSLLIDGLTLEAVTGEALLSALLSVSFEGVSGSVKFDSNGDREGSYHVWNVQNSSALEVALFSSGDDVITPIDERDLLWTSGAWGFQLPTEFIDCEAGDFLDSQATCQACPSDQVTASDKRSCQECSGSTIALSDGTCGYDPLKLGLFGPFTGVSMEYLAAAVMFDLDFRKNFEPDLVEEFGKPIITINDLHPRLRVDLQIGNSDAQPEVGMAEALDMFQGTNGRSKVVGLVGGAYSSVSMPIASLATQFKVLQISYGATNAKLSSKDEYPYFLRTIPPDSIQAAGQWRFIKFFRVGSVTWVYSEESYGEGLFQTVSNLAAKDGESYRIEAAAIEYMPTKYDASIARAGIDQVRAMASKVIFLTMTGDQGRQFWAIVLAEQLLSSMSFQVLASEALSYTILHGDVPAGYMWFSPVNKGALYERFSTMWTKMSAAAVIGDAARERYGIDLFKVGLSEGTVEPISDGAFESAENLIPNLSFLFDAVYTFTMAANSLLNNGTALEDIKGSLLLSALGLTNFTGISGPVSFDENGDRLASYSIWNVQPVVRRRLELSPSDVRGDFEQTFESWAQTQGPGRSLEESDSDEVQSVVVAVYSSVDDEITLQEHVPYWMVGESGSELPSVLTACDEGHYQNANLICQSCSPGTYSSGGAVTVCTKCQAGRVANTEIAATSCVDCLAGTAGLEAASTNCTECTAGTFSNEDRATICTSCDLAFYQPGSGQTTCRACGENMLTLVIGASSEEACICSEGFYRDSREDPEAPCLPCKEGMSCAAGSDMKYFYAELRGETLEKSQTFPKLQSSYMSLRDEPLSVYKCTSAAKCPGGSPGTCTPGIAPDVSGCAHCEDGKYWDGQDCGECTWTERTCLIFPLLPLVLSPLLFVTLYWGANIQSESWGSWRYGMSAVAFLLLNHYQMTSLINHSNTTKGGAVTQAMSFFGFSEDPTSLFNTECAGYRDKVAAMLLRTLTPVALLLPLLLTFYSSHFIRAALRNKSLRMDRDVTFNVYFSLIFTFFAGIAAMSLDTFRCSDNPNGLSTLSSDQSFICGSDAWWGLVIISVVAVCLYLVGVGGVFGYIVVVAPRHFTDSGFRMRWAFLFFRFRPDVWWWGLLFIAKGICTNIGYMFIRLGSAQMIWVMVTVTVYAGFVARFFPWRLRAVNALDLYANVALLFVSALLAVLTYAQSVSTSVSNGISVAIIIITISPLPVAALVAGYIVYVHNHPAPRQARLKALALLVPALEDFSKADIDEKIEFLEGIDEWARSGIMETLHIISSEFHGVCLKARLTDQRLVTKSFSTTSVDSKQRGRARDPPSSVGDVSMEKGSSVESLRTVGTMETAEPKRASLITFADSVPEKDCHDLGSSLEFLGAVDSMGEPTLPQQPQTNLTEDEDGGDVGATYSV